MEYKKNINGIVVEMPPEEVAAMEAAAREERKRPLDREEVLGRLFPGMIAERINGLEVDDAEALRMQEFYPEWGKDADYTAQAGRPVGYRVRRGDGLYKLRQEHRSQVGWEPENVPSLWELICEEHDGSLDDPIPVPDTNGMALEAGKYYSQGGVVYRCINSTGNPVYHALAALVGVYVEIVC